MIIRGVYLQNFRNYENLKLELDDGINILYGDNAQGKTNVLEAICVAATAKSHRSSRDNEMISFGKSEAHIKILEEKENIACRIDVHLKKNNPKGIAIDGIALKRASELYGTLKTVIFSPEDLNIVKSSPSVRRRFIDLEICQTDKIYVHDLASYTRVLNQKNALLKEKAGGRETDTLLDVYDGQLSQYGERIIRRRERFLNETAEIVKRIHEGIAEDEKELTVVYCPSSKKGELEKNLRENREREKILKATLTGPHRDDFVFTIDARDIKKFGSQGQQRTAALSLKLAEIEIIKRETKETPVLLLDDVLSELDSKRQRQLIELISTQQTIITCTGLDEFVENRLKIDRIYKVEKGKIYPHQK